MRKHAYYLGSVLFVSSCGGAEVSLPNNAWDSKKEETSSVSGVGLRGSFATDSSGNPVYDADNVDDFDLVKTSGTRRYYQEEDSISVEYDGETLTDKEGSYYQEDAAVYTYVRSYELSYSETGKLGNAATGVNIQGVHGIAVSTGDMQSIKDVEVVYTGEAFGMLVESDGSFELKEGRSVVTAKFAEKTASVDLYNFTAQNLVHDSEKVVPIDQITIKGMTIEDSSFVFGSSSTLETSFDGENVDVVDVIGDNATHDAIGHFYGWKEKALLPAEVGGTLLSRGDSGLLTATFIGKK